ncbi:MAG: 50S ribosomal protein L28 [Candidatus Cloacimonetes bacterium]|nr:50S ribosomal protein L28 [Candidatus Cloacimonadota bacterium]
MSRVCDICGKKPLVGNHRSHALNATKRKYYPNLQKIKADIEGKIQRIRICTSCLRANKVRKVV